MQGIYTYIPETNCVPKEYSVAAILLLLFIVLISLVLVLNLLYFYISTFRSMCAMPNMAVFCSSLTSLLLLLLFRTRPVRPGAHPASCTMGTGSLRRGYSSRGVALTAHPHLVPT